MACLLKVSFPVLSFKSCSTSLRHTANMRPGIQTQMPFHGHCSLTGLLLDRNPPYRTWIFYSWARISRIASKTRYSELFITPGEFLTHLQTQPSQKCDWRRRCQRPLEDVHICLLTGVRSHAWLRDTLTGQWPAPWHTAQHIRSSRPGPVRLGHLGQLLALSLSALPLLQLFTSLGKLEGSAWDPPWGDTSLPCHTHHGLRAINKARNSKWQWQRDTLQAVCMDQREWQRGVCELWTRFPSLHPQSDRLAVTRSSDGLEQRPWLCLAVKTCRAPGDAEAAGFVVQC